MATQVSTQKKTASAPPPGIEAQKGSRLTKPASQYTYEEIEALSQHDPDEAQRLINLQESLKRTQTTNEQKRSLIRMQANNAREVERGAIEEAQAQALCARTMHSYNTGETRLRGQFVGQGRDRVLQLTCNFCYQQYTGVGDGKYELPPAIANRIDLSVYGG